MVFHAPPQSMAVELQMDAMARLDAVLSLVKLARRELREANALIEIKTKAG